MHDSIQVSHTDLNTNVLMHMYGFICTCRYIMFIYTGMMHMKICMYFGSITAWCATVNTWNINVLPSDAVEEFLGRHICKEWSHAILSVPEWLAQLFCISIIYIIFGYTWLSHAATGLLVHMQLKLANKSCIWGVQEGRQVGTRYRV